MSSSVVVVGFFNVDYVWCCELFLVLGVIIVGCYSIGLGGKGFNQVVVVCCVGVLIIFVCVLGDDVGGVMVCGLVVDDGFILQVEVSIELIGIGGIYVDSCGCNMIVIGLGVNVVLSIVYVEQQCVLLSGVKVVLVQLELLVEIIEVVLVIVCEVGVIIVFNVVLADVLFSIGLFKLVDVLILNEIEFVVLFGCYVGECVDVNDVVVFDGVSLYVLCCKLVGNGIVVVMLGLVGVFVLYVEENLCGDIQLYYWVGVEQVQVLDIIGVGDVFNGVLVVFIVQDLDVVFVCYVCFVNQFVGCFIEKEGVVVVMLYFILQDVVMV